MAAHDDVALRIFIDEQLIGWSGQHSACAPNSISELVKLVEQDRSVPTGVLCRLAMSTSAPLRIAVGEHDNSTHELLCRLASDVDPDVRYSIAENHNIFFDVLNRLRDDANPYVASRAARTLQRLGMIDLQQPSWGMRHATRVL